MGAARNAPALTSADVVYYGSYPQSGTSTDFTVEPVLWRVLEVSGDKTAFMLSEKILDGGVSFNPDYNGVDPCYTWWSESQIRKFLNGAEEYVKSVSADETNITVRNPKGYSFYEKAFSAGEGSGIISIDVDNSSVYGSSTVTPGPNTTDKIFLLSYAGAGNFAYGFVDNDSRKAELTDYGASQGVYNNMEGNKKYGYWWLRSPGYYVRSASFVYDDGSFHFYNVNVGTVGLRPAFRLNLESLLFTFPAAGGKQYDMTASLHKQTYASNNKRKYEHKLTLATNTYKLMLANVTSGDIKEGQDVNITLKYDGASTGAGYHLAAAVTSGDRALYYGRIKSLEAAADKSGTVTFVIPEYHEGEEVYIFVEGRNNNGDYKTDFASVPICIAGSGRTIKPLPKDVEELRPETKSITVDPSELTLVKGYDKKLTAYFAPEGALEEVTWNSDKPDVAAVDPVTGVVSALKAGSAKVTAKASGKEAFCTVTVIEKALNPALILTPAAMTVSNGMTEKITVVFQDITEQPLTWSSSKESVATVEQDGTVTAVSEGTCVIRAVTEDGSYSASCDVTVKETPQKPRLALSPEAMTIGRGMTEKIKAAFHGMAEQPLTWSSGEESVATVEQDGTVTAVSKGNCVITAATKDGSYSASCDVTVKEAPQKPALILTPAAMTVSKGVTEKITADFHGMGKQPLTWSSSDPTVATVDKDGKVTAKNEGTCVITAATEDGAYSASCEVKVTAAAHGGGSGGCSTAGFGLFALLISMPLIFRKSAGRK